MEHVRIGYITVPREKARELATEIIEERLAACINIIPQIDSVYWWDGKINCDEESLLMVKTLEAKVEALIAFVKEIHPYDIPEIVFLKLTEGLPDYLNYVIEEMGKSD